MTVAIQMTAFVNRITNSINILQGVQGALVDLTTTDKTTLVSALNEIKATVELNYTAQEAIINDLITGASSTWSSNMILDEINQAVTDLIDGAPGALDTLKELAAALQNNPDIVDNILIALDYRVKVDGPQSFTTLEQTQARTNINAASDTEFQALINGLGTYDKDYAAYFNSLLI